MTSIGIIGECMIELSQSHVKDGDEELYQKRYGGDTYNTAYYLAQCAKTSLDVDYVTALGDDDISQDMISVFSKAGVGTDLIEQIPGSVPGLYAIQTDENGERSFLYWRSEAPVRKLFQTDYSETLKSALLQKDWIYFSGITLAVLYPEGREALFDLCREHRQKGGKVAFDLNYRPRLWRSLEEAKQTIDTAYGLCDLALPSYDDEKLLYTVKTPQEAIERIENFGIQEIVLKNGPEELYVFSEDKTLKYSVLPATTVIDTTSAGDSFNAGYLYARLSNKSISAAVEISSDLAKQVIAQKGAIVPVKPLSLS